MTRFAAAMLFVASSAFAQGVVQYPSAGGLVTQWQYIAPLSEMVIESSSTSDHIDAHIRPNLVLRTGHYHAGGTISGTPPHGDGAGGVITYQTKNDARQYRDAVRINGGLVGTVPGNEHGDLDFQIYRSGQVEVLAIRGDVSAFMPEKSGMWNLGTPVNTFDKVHARTLQVTNDSTAAISLSAWSRAFSGNNKIKTVAGKLIITIDGKRYGIPVYQLNPGE